MTCGQRVGRRGASQLGDAHRDQLLGGFGHRDVLLVEVVEWCAQRGARLVQAGLDGAGTGAEFVGDLGVRQPRQVEQRHRRSLAGRQARDGRPHTGGQLARFRPAGGIGVESGQIDERWIDRAFLPVTCVEH